jgi:hypothetical protein
LTLQAKKLLKLRATFQENAKVGKAYRVDLKLPNVDKVVILKGPEQINPRTNEWLGLQGMKHKYLTQRLKGYELITIEVDQWKQISEGDKLEFLYSLSRTKEDRSRSGGTAEDF